MTGKGRGWDELWRPDLKKWGASSRWTLSPYHLIQIWDEMTMGKTQPTLIKSMVNLTLFVFEPRAFIFCWLTFDFTSNRVQKKPGNTTHYSARILFRMLISLFGLERSFVSCLINSIKNQLSNQLGSKVGCVCSIGSNSAWSSKVTTIRKTHPLNHP